jgi:CHAD domain-containing protein
LELVQKGLPAAGGELGRRVDPDEALPSAVQRITVHLLDNAIVDLRQPEHRSFDANIHSARKNLKRLRGMIRLVRDQVGYRAYREENVVLRDTARMLSGLRDAGVLPKTLKAVRSHYKGLLDEDTFATPRAWLKSRRDERRSAVDQAIVHNAIVNLGSARSRFARYPIESVVSDEFDAIAPGIHRVYRRGLRGFEQSVDTRHTDALHEWRKRVKYLRFQMEALTPIQPGLIGATAKQLNVLGELIGDDRDLAVLADTILEHPESCRDERERRMLIMLIHERRLSHQLQAFRLGGALYAESPDAFVDRLGAYWDAGKP